MLDSGILSMLSAGGDLATIALVIVMWKFDRRLLRIEILYSQMLRKIGIDERAEFRND